MTSSAEFYRKYVSQGCWTRCLECQRTYGPSTAATSTTETTTAVEKEIASDACKFCGECFPRLALECGNHGCSACRKVLPAKHWNKDKQKNHRRYKRRLVCDECATIGFTATDWAKYKCVLCVQTMGHMNFDPDALKNYKTRAGSSLECKDCKAKFKCKACNVLYAPTEWTADVRKHHKNRGDALVCITCTKQGCTPQDPELYECKMCRKKLGTKRYNGSDLLHYKYHSYTKLHCAQCKIDSTTREKELQRKVKGSKYFCKCGCPIHTERCPLTPCYAGERRWPGSDNGISAEDRVFLDLLNPRPKWWSNASRKPR